MSRRLPRSRFLCLPGLGQCATVCSLLVTGQLSLGGRHCRLPTICFWLIHRALWSPPTASLRIRAFDGLPVFCPDLFRGYIAVMLPSSYCVFTGPFVLLFYDALQTYCRGLGLVQHLVDRPVLLFSVHDPAAMLRNAMRLCRGCSTRFGTFTFARASIYPWVCVCNRALHGSISPVYRSQCSWGFSWPRMLLLDHSYVRSTLGAAYWSCVSLCTSCVP